MSESMLCFELFSSMEEVVVCGSGCVSDTDRVCDL